MSILLLTGLQGSGKSTIAQEWIKEDPFRRHRINYDDLRMKLYGPDWQFNRDEEEAMKAVAVANARAHIRNGHDVVIDNTNLTARHRSVWIKLAQDENVTLEQQDVDTSADNCVLRDAARRHPQCFKCGITFNVGDTQCKNCGDSIRARGHVGRALIERNALFYGYIDLNDRDVYSRDFLIVDMDGTVAGINDERRQWIVPHCRETSCGLYEMFLPQMQEQFSEDKNALVFINAGQCPSCNQDLRKNWDKFYIGVEKDEPIKPILMLVEALREYFDLDVLVVSGRPLNKAGLATEDWLRDHDIPIRHLFMRGQNDFRDDFIIKKDILDMMPKDRIRYVLDDRNQVVKMWREAGLTCLQVAEGNF